MVSLKPEPGRYDKALFIPITALYFGDETLFSRLKLAYESRNRKTLEQLWRQARPLKEAA